MAGRKSDFTLTRLDDLFTTQAQREEERLSKIRDIPLELIDEFPDHPFKVRDDEDMQQLVASIKERGVITPATVRQKEDGRYELVSGHRRKRASELAGFETLRCEVVDLNRDEATILMVESNFQRSQILPSEKAFAYKMRLDEQLLRRINITLKKTFGLWIYKEEKKENIRCLCPKCLNDYIHNPDYIVRRLDPFAKVKDHCDKCNQTGWDYVISERQCNAREKGCQNV